MEAPKSVGPSANPLLSFSSFIHQNFLRRLGAEFAGRLDDTRRFTSKFVASLQTFTPPCLPSYSSSSPTSASSPLVLSFASVSQSSPRRGKQGPTSAATTLSSEHVAKTLAGTSVYTVSNSNNEFVLISNTDGIKSIGLLCFRHEDAEAFLAQVKTRKGELKRGAKVVPISLQQVYMLKVEGIAFRFLPDPVQIKNALELKSSKDKSGFDGVPVFQSDLLVVKRRNKRYSPIYFRKEDIEKELSKVSKGSRGSGVSQHIMVGSLEDVLKKMGVSGNWVGGNFEAIQFFRSQTSSRNSGWEDLIFIPPGKSHSQHIEEVAKA